MATPSSMLNKEEKLISVSSCKLRRLFIVEKCTYLDWKTGELVWLGIVLTLIDWIKWALDISLLSKHRSSS